MFASKYKPTRTPVTDSLIRSKEYGWAIISGILEVALVSNAASVGLEYWCCGNPLCSTPILVRNRTIPQVCPKCGGEIEWINIKTRIVKVCPECKRQGSVNDVYCIWHKPAIMLNDVEIPL